MFACIFGFIPGNYGLVQRKVICRIPNQNLYLLAFRKLCALIHCFDSEGVAFVPTQSVDSHKVAVVCGDDGYIAAFVCHFIGVYSLTLAV